MKQVFNPHTGKPDYVLDSDTIARNLYGLGVMLVVAGPMVAGTDPPQMSPATAAQVAHLLSIGIPETHIGWSVTGSESISGSYGTFALPSVTLQPVVAAPSLSGVQVGSFALPSVTLTPVVAAPSLAGVQIGSFALPAVTLQPQVSAPTLVGLQDGVGSFDLPTVTLQPQVAAPSLVGVQVGAFTLPSVSLQPVVSAPSLAGAQAGSFTLPSVSLHPVVAAPTLTATVAATSGSFTLPAVTLRPVVTAPTLTGVSSSTTITEDFDTAIPSTYAALAVYPSNMAATASVQGWTIGSSGYDPGSVTAYDYFNGASVGTGAGGYSGNALVINGCYIEDADSNVLARSGYKCSKTFTGPFAAGTFSLRYKQFAGSGTVTIKVNSVSMGTITANGTWMLASLSVGTVANIMLEIECAPASATASPPQILIDSISYI